MKKNRTLLSHVTVFEALCSLRTDLDNLFPDPNKLVRVWGVPRGGIPAAYMLTGMQQSRYRLALSPSQADLILDDLVNSGATKRRYQNQFPDTRFAALFSKHEKGRLCDYAYGQWRSPDDWLVLPWEEEESGTDRSADEIVTRLLEYIGEDPNRGGLLETPARALKAWDAWSDGYKTDVPALLKTFDDGAEGYDQLVLVADIPVYSHCEHHLAPFFGVAHVAYLPSKRIVGLSKLSRVVDAFAHRLQVQERLTVQIADALWDGLDPRGIAVVLECRHLCMESRGIRRSGSATTTSALRGLLKDSHQARAEFLDLLAMRKAK